MVFCTPGPGIRDHHQRTQEYLPLGTNLEVVVGSKLHFTPPTLCDATHLTAFHSTAFCSPVAACL